jgi:hypothetical protein
VCVYESLATQQIPMGVDLIQPSCFCSLKAPYKKSHTVEDVVPSQNLTFNVRLTYMLFVKSCLLDVAYGC